MGLFITDDEALFADKVPAPGLQLRVGWTADNVISAANANALRDACYDLRTYVKPKLGGHLWLETGDARSTIQNKLDDLTAQGGGLLEGGFGDWGSESDEPLDINGDVIIRGSGAGVTTIHGRVRVNPGAGVETLKAGLQFLTLDGGNSSSGADYGITLGHNTAASFKTGAGLFIGVEVKRFSSAGVRGVYTAFAEWLHCHFVSNKKGWWADPTVSGAVTTQKWDMCRFSANSEIGCHIENADTLRWDTCFFEDNGYQGLLAKHPGVGGTLRSLTLESCRFEDNSAAAGNTYANMDFDTATSGQIIQTAIIRGCTFINALGGSGAKYHIQFYQGRFELESPEFNPISTACVNVRDTSVAFLTVRTDRDPATFMTVGATAPVRVLRSGASTGASPRWYSNNGTTTLSQYGVRSSSSTTTQRPDDTTIRMNANGGNLTLNLLSAAASTTGVGHRLTIIKTDASANTVTIDGSGTETINGALTKVLAAQYDMATIESDGTNWLVVS